MISRSKGAIRGAVPPRSGSLDRRESPSSSGRHPYLAALSSRTKRGFNPLGALAGTFLFLLSSQAHVQPSLDDDAVCREDAALDTSCGEPPIASAATTVARFSPGLFELPGFLFGLHAGPFFSFGGLVGGDVAVDFQFKVHRNSYLGLQGGYLGGYQVTRRRTDSHFSGLLAYRHYFLQPGGTAFSIAAGPSLGYYLTGPQNDRPGYDWISAGIRAAGAYHVFLDERTSFGVGVGLALFHQFSEFHDRADNFTTLSPELVFSLTL